MLYSDNSLPFEIVCMPDYCKKTLCMLHVRGIMELYRTRLEQHNHRFLHRTCLWLSQSFSHIRNEMGMVKAYVMEHELVKVASDFRRGPKPIIWSESNSHTFTSCLRKCRLGKGYFGEAN